MISGGWDFVWSAYGIAWATLALYGASLYARTRRAEEAAHVAQKAEMRA